MKAENFESFDKRCKARLKEKGYSITDKSLLVTYNVILFEMLMELNEEVKELKNLNDKTLCSNL